MQSSENTSDTNYKMVSQWAANLNVNKAFKEILDLKAKYNWIHCPEATRFIADMHEDLPRILHIILIQEKRCRMLEKANEKLHGYIRANHMADEVIIDELNKRYNLGI